ncbi:hypothetical protein FA15DRAFT_602882, partial [Coprinopsis marcescibilis]
LIAMAAVTASPAHHYIRTIHTSFTAAHSNPWARTTAHASPLLTSNHANMPLYTSQPHAAAGQHVHSNPNAPLKPLPTNVGGGGRRRAYAFRAPAVAAPVPRSKSAYKFDPFADEPTTPVPTLSTLASLSVPPAPRLSHASLPAPRRAHSPSGLYNHQLHQQQQVQHRRNMGYQGRRHPGSFDMTGSTEIWRGFSSPITKTRNLAYEIEEYDDSPSFSGGLLNTPLSKSGPPAAAAPVARRSSSPSTLNPASPVFTPSRPLARTPSPPTPAPAPTFAATRSSMLNDKNAKARLVAGILLNRVHLSKPNRRRPVVGDAKRPYVPSGLRSVVTCEA